MFIVNEKRRCVGMMTALIACLVVVGTVQADTAWQEKIRLFAFDGATQDFFGSFSSIDGDYAIVGAYHDNNYTGSAYVFKYDGICWALQAKLTASDGAINDYFGWPVAIKGEYAIVGAPLKNNPDGSAYIFKRNGENWTEQAILTASDAAAGNQFGCAVAISSNYAIVGAYGNDDKGNDSGSAYIFQRNDTTWTEQTKLLAGDGAAGDEFGRSVAMDDNGYYVVVGAHYDDDNGTNSGSAYTFYRDIPIWTWYQHSKLTASNGAAYDSFGSSVSIDGDYVAVGADTADPDGSNSGSAYIFKRSGLTWPEQDILTRADGAASDYFGSSVSIDGDYVIVGTPGDDDDGSGSGSAYIFKRDDTDWTQQVKLHGSANSNGDNFGTSVSISGDLTIIGAQDDDVKATDCGSAYIFKKETICPSADLSGNCIVNLEDFATMARQWLQDWN